MGMLAPLLVPWVVASDLPIAWSASLSGLLILGIPELFVLASVAILGKEGYAYMKGRLAGALRPASPVRAIPPVRHRIGVAMFATAVLAGWGLPYATAWKLSLHETEIWIAIGLNVVFLASLVVLGNNFWAKLHALFEREATARSDVPETPAFSPTPDVSMRQGSI
jgi:hypothetical protein